MMQVTLSDNLRFDLYQLEDTADATSVALRTNGRLYSRMTTENSNWFQRGMWNINVLGIVVLPYWYPERIDLPDDVDYR